MVKHACVGVFVYVVYLAQCLYFLTYHTTFMIYIVKTRRLWVEIGFSE